jgi:hypothetical protein
LVFVLVEENARVSSSDDFTVLFEPSGVVQGVESFSDVNFVDVEIFAVFIDDSKEFSVDVEFQDSCNGEIGRDVPEIGVNSWVDSEVFEVEIAGIDIINDNEDKIRED